MNIREEILAEHSKAQSMKIAAFACSSPKNFKELMLCFQDPEYCVAQRAAWSVCHSVRLKPEMIKPYISKLVDQLDRTDVHPAVIRNSIRILEELEIPEALHGKVMNACFRFIETPATPVAIKAFSLTTLHRLSRIYPDIRHELKLLIEENWDHETAAFRSRGRKILKDYSAFKNSS